MNPIRRILATAEAVLTLRNFTLFRNEVRQVRIPYVALIKAAITAGHERGEQWKDGAHSILQATIRVSNILRALEVENGRLYATSHFRDSVDPTEKGQISNCIGNTFCGVLAERIAKVPWLLSLELYNERLNPTFSPGGSRPDYLGRSTESQWFVFEAKGRTSTPSPQNLLDWKGQSAAITHVGGQLVACGLASVALVNGDDALVALWDDPPPEESSPAGANLEISVDEFFKLYYEPILTLVNGGADGAVYLPDLDLSVSVHRTVLQILSDRAYPELNGFAKQVMVAPDDFAAVESEESLFPDGVIIKFGPSWARKAEEGAGAPSTVQRRRRSAAAGASPWPLATASPHSIRDELTQMVVRDLLGPAGGPEEELDQREDHAYGRYLVGLLAPRSAKYEPEQDDRFAADNADDAETGPAEASTVPTQTFFPNSIGMSFVVDRDEKAVLVHAEWARYRRVKSETQVKRATGQPAPVWKREPHVPKPLPLELKDGLIAPLSPDENDAAVVLQGKMRRTPHGWLVTLFLVNQTPEQEWRKDEAWVFQPKVAVTDAAVPPRPVFVQRNDWKRDLSRMDPITREETETLEMLYRHRREFAVGHGVSIHATLPEPEAIHALRVETEFVPRSEVEQQTPPTAEDNPDVSPVVLDMQQLAQMPKSELLSALRALPTAYAAWITREEAKRSDPSQRMGDHQTAATRAIERCRRACERITEGIDLIESEGSAEAAFRFANEAMWQQRIHSVLSRKVRKKEANVELAAIDVPGNRSWRLFQLAFVILNLPSLTRFNHPDRSHPTDAVADLLWFATGGGKTEAYLGLTAYTLALRRLQGDIEGRAGDHGIAVLMRYTLRLLTLQQFQRATALICACEVIRKRDEARWGRVPFRVGLWVGAKATPNTLNQAAEALRQSHTGGRPTAGGTPHQIVSCPWCGHEIQTHHLKVLEPPSEIGRCVTYCGDATGACEFSEARSPREGLPVMVVDEDIYRRPPALLIATVDKFAQMPWKGEVQHLFGQVSGLCLRHGFLSPEIEKDDTGNHPARGPLQRVQRQPHGPLRPPDLIIQDELHLLSGPLGSMVALYETAIDELCAWQVNGKRVRPKVIASTATIRRAPDQVQKLFLRKLEVFPPQGTSIKDSFFSIQRPASSEYPGRRYLGICAFGRRYPASLIRVYTALMASAQVLYNRYDNLADPWMTLTGYFNSIRELAGTRRLVEDDIRTRLRDSDQRGLAKRQIRYGAVEELTSRKSGTDIPKILERLEIIFDKAQDAQRDADRKAGTKMAQRPFDAILATNMISVGVDIDRLGLMAVAGQPKTTSEYIQATSRVGRSKAGPGLVVTIFNWARPRDLSHYETFEHYHETFYKHVEALSVTPFSARALDRGLAGVFAAILRLQEERLNENTKAGTVTDTDPAIADVINRIVSRAENTTQDASVGQLVRGMLQDRRQHWLARVRNQTDHRLGYRDDTQSVVGLLQQPGATNWELFTCLNSLRDVEGTVNLILDQNTAGLRADGHGGEA